MNPGQIVNALTTHPRVTEVVVIPVRSPEGPVIGALVECEGAVDAGELRGAAARMLPAWLHPQVLAITGGLPRLTGGKADREGCQAILRRTRGWSDPV